MVGVFVPWGSRKDSPGWIEDENGCHIWTGRRNGSGHAQGYANGRMQYVYRVRYEREIGPIPDGMELDHYVCDNGPGGCCNPHHCRPASHRENVLRGRSFAARNAAKTHCLRGHPLSGENVYRSAKGRECRTCTRALTKVKTARRRVARNQRRSAARSTPSTEQMNWKPGDTATWLHASRGGDGYIRRVPAEVVRLTPMRVTIRAKLASGDPVLRTVRPENLRRPPD